MNLLPKISNSFLIDKVDEDIKDTAKTLPLEFEVEFSLHSGNNMKKEMISPAFQYIEPK